MKLATLGQGRKIREFFRKVLGLLNPPLLFPVGKVAVAATEESIVLSADVLRERYNVKWYGRNFGAWFLDRTTAPFRGSTLAYRKLVVRRFVDSSIIMELGGAITTRTEPIEMLRLIEVQKNGGDGPLLTNGCANIFYWEDKVRLSEDEQVTYTNEGGEKVVLRAVGAFWDSDDLGWNVNARSVLVQNWWIDDDQFFSRDSRLPSAA